MADVLIIKPSSVGDVVHGLLVAQSIKEQCPAWRVDWVVRDRFADLVTRAAAVDDVFLFRRGQGPVPFLRLLRDVRRRRYDAVLDLQGLLRTGIMTLATRAAEKFGRSDAREGAGLFYGERAPLPTAGRDAHAVDILLEFLPLLGLSRQLPAALAYDVPDVARVSVTLATRPYILLCPASRGAGKDWPHFGDLAAVLRERAGGHAVVWDADRSLPDPPGAGDRFVNTSGRTSLADLMALVESASLVVANDSGPVHMAAALGTPVLGLYGPTPASRFGPYPATRAGHRALEAPDGDLSRLAVDDVLASVLDLLRPVSAQTG